MSSQRMLTTPAISADNLRRLLVLRGISLLAALAMTLLAEPLFHVLPDMTILLAVCGVWAIFSLATWARTLRPHPVKVYELTLHLAADLLLLTVFLVFSGGTANPLTALYLMPVAAAAALLPPAFAWTTAAVAIGAYALLWVVAVPITVEDTDAAMQMHLAGMWLSFGLSAALLVGIVARMSSALRAREQHLAAAHERALRNEHIVALGSLAAGAAHQLGTPLNTAMLLADEISANAAAGSETAADARELRVQIDRCRDIVKGLLDEAGAGRNNAVTTLTQWLEQLVASFRHRRGDCLPVIEIRDGLEAFTLRPDLALAHALTDLLDNAADVSAAQVVITVTQPDNDHLRIAVRDDGAGFSAAALARIGRAPWSDKPQGLGLGLYLAHATAERLGGELRWRNLDRGAEVALHLPLAVLDAKAQR